jgi:uncharacterized protein YgbK (DUF1537 family)
MGEALLPEGRLQEVQKYNCGMASPTVGIVADDLTGAADTAAAFARPGRPVRVLLDGPAELTASRSALAVTTESRACEPDRARELVLAGARKVLDGGAGVIYKKVDSGLRGNVGHELAALCEAIQRPVIFAPAFPARGRTTVNGVALIDGTPVAETEMARDPQAPVRDSVISELIHSQQRGLSVGHCSLSEVRAGSGAVAACLRGASVLVADAVTDQDLLDISEAALSLSPIPTLAGSAGLASAMARHLLGRRRSAAWPESDRGPVLALIASASDRLPSQNSSAASRTDLRPVALPCTRLSWGNQVIPELEKASAQALRELHGERDAVVYAAGALPEVARPVELVVDRLARLATLLVEQADPRGLLVGGGATASAVLEALGALAIEVDDEPLPGVASGLIVGGSLADRPVVLKPGAAGDDDAIVTLIRYLRRRAM